MTTADDDDFVQRVQQGVANVRRRRRRFATAGCAAAIAVAIAAPLVLRAGDAPVVAAVDDDFDVTDDIMDDLDNTQLERALERFDARLQKL